MSTTSRRRRLAAVTAALALTATPAALAVSADATTAASRPAARVPLEKPKTPKPGRLKLHVLALNDFHGQLEVVPPTSSSGRISTGPDTSVPAGGAAYLATHLQQLRRAAHEKGQPTVTVAAGDLMGATPLVSAAFHDEPSVEALNRMRLDIASVGNHEFDEGYKELLRIQRGGCIDDGDGRDNQNSCPDPARPFQGADYRYLSANVKYAGTDRTVFPAYAVRKFRGVKVGFIGLTLQDTPNIVTKSGVEGLRFTDEVRTVRKLIPTLRKKNVRSIVVLLHQGGTPAADTYDYNGCPDVTGPGRDIAEQLHSAVDVVVSGHTHQAYNCTVLDPSGEPRLFTSASSVGRLVTDIRLTIDRRTKDVIRPRMHAKNVIVTNQDGTAPRRAIVRLIERYQELVEPIANRVIGQLQGTDKVTRDADADGGDSPLGNLIADSQLADPSTIPTSGPAAGQEPVLALMNPGGIRSDLNATPSGDITFGAAFAVQPFNNYVVSMTLTGEQLLSVLNEQWNGRNEGAANYKVLQVAGLSYSWDRSLAAEADADALVAESVRVDSDGDGAPDAAVDPSASYRVVVNSFLADGGDGFATLAEGADRYFGGLDIDSLATYLGTSSPYTPTPTDRISAVD